MFGCDYTLVQRQGDLCLLPARPTKDAVATSVQQVLLQDSHQLSCQEIRVADNGTLYAKNAYLAHLPGTHPTVQTEGLCRVVVSKRASFWDFAAPTID